MHTTPAEPRRWKPSQAAITPFVFILILVIAVAFLFSALRSVAPWSLDVGAKSDEQFVVGFFHAERDGATTFRWSRPSGQLTLYGAQGRRLALRMYGSGDSHPPQSELHLGSNQRSIGSFTVEGGWRIYRVLLPPTATDGAIPLDFASASHQANAADDRDLGAASVDWVQVVPLNAGIEGWWPPLASALLLTGVLALIAIALAIAQRFFAPQSAFLPAWILLLLACASIILSFWAQNDPHTLSLAIPQLSPWLLLAATLALIAIGWRHETRDARNIMFHVSHLMPHVSRFTIPIAAIALHLMIAFPLPVELRGTCALLLLGLPGAMLAALWFDGDGDWLTNTLLMIGGALTLQQLLVFALQTFPGPLLWWQLLLANDAILVLLFWLQLRSDLQRLSPRHPVTPSPRHPVVALTIVLLLAGFLRLTNLGAAEFQADEIRPMYLAAGILHGQEGILLLHRKGPVEVLLPAGPLVLLGQTSEFVARLPFALAGLGIVFGVYMFARSLIAGRTGAAIGLIAAAILSVDGFLVAFSRIVQYQSIVVLMSLLAIWCAWRFYNGESARRYLVGAAVFAAMSMLAHYDGIFAIPLIAFLAFAGCRGRGWPVGRWVSALWQPVSIGSILLLSFYGPFFFSERFERTTAYLGRRLAQQPAFVESTGGPPFNNLPGYYAIMTFYNTTPQIVWYALVLALAAAVALVSYVRPRLLAFVLAGLFLVSCGLLAFAPDRLLLPNGGSFALFPCTLVLGALILSPRTPTSLRILLLWFAPPFLAEAFLIAKPDTHFYNIHAPSALLIALSLVGALRWLAQRRLRPMTAPLLAGHALVVLLAIPYLNLLFVRQIPQYEPLFPALRPVIYQARYGDQRPAGGSFGFPNSSGWKAVGALYESGALKGDFETNGMKQIIGWYTRDVFRCYDQPAYYFVDRMPRNSVKIPIDYVQQNYHLFGYVLTDGVRMLDIYSKAPTNESPHEFDLADYTRPFDGQSVSDFPTSRLLTNEIVPQHHLVADWQGGIRLRGFDLDHKQIAPSEEAVMSFYWQAAGPIEPGYAVAVEIADQNGQVVGAGTPYCGGDPPEEWYTQYVNDIAFKVAPNGQMPPGSYTLRVGLRHAQTGAWLPLADGSQTIPFTQITVAENSAQ